jgi:hypothetical protein
VAGYSSHGLCRRDSICTNAILIRVITKRFLEADREDRLLQPHYGLGREGDACWQPQLFFVEGERVEVENINQKYKYYIVG